MPVCVCWCAGVPGITLHTSEDGGTHFKAACLPVALRVSGAICGSWRHDSRQCHSRASEAAEGGRLVCVMRDVHKSVCVATFDLDPGLPPPRGQQ
jgi:hypothetical protein